MTTYAPPTPRRAPSRAVLMGGLAAVTAAAVATGVVVTSDPAPSGSSAVESVRVETSQRAADVAAVATQLEALRRLGSANPAVRASLAQDITTLEAALAGDIPLEAALPATSSDEPTSTTSSVPTTVR